MVKGFFITGTDTGVGKTVVTATLAMLFRKHRWKAGVMKPIETGVHQSSRHGLGNDARFLKIAAGSRDAAQLIGPYRFKLPLSPLIAAEAEGRTINLKKIRNHFNTLSFRHQIVLVEGAGGIMVPLTERETNLDLIRQLSLPVILVVGNKLGAINQTLLTLHCARSHKIDVKGIIINQMRQKQDPAMKSNLRVLQSLAGVPILGVIPYIQGLNVEKLRLGELRSVLNRLDKSLNYFTIKLNSRVAP